MTEYFYRDHIYVRCDQGYKLMMVRPNFVLSNDSQCVEYDAGLTFEHQLPSEHSGDQDFLYSLSKQWTVAPPSARMSQYVQL